jgi:hypothetical protein
VSISWDKTTEKKFHQMIEKIPVFLRSIAKEKVLRKAEHLAR